MQDVFSQDAPFGVFTGTNIGENIARVRGKIKEIDRLYIEFCLKPTVETSKQVTFFRTHKKGEFVTTRQQLHADLREGYGGDSDTDGEGYDSDTANQATPQCSRETALS